MGSAPISLIILTHNEEVNVERTLKSVQGWVGEILIVDSFSTDRTLEICRKYTDRIVQHEFENQAKQFNWALDNVSLRCPWVMRLDADEWATPELAREISETVPALPEAVAGIYLKRRVYFLGRWIRYGAYYPMWFLRIFRKGTGRYEEIAEEHILLSSGKTVRFQNDFVDENRKGISFWVDKHNHWAIGEMLDLMSYSRGKGLPAGTLSPSLFSTQERRRRWLKIHLYARFPILLRAFGYFFHRYFLQLGFLDGKEGLIFHFLQGCWYRFLVDAKIYEARKFGLRQAETARHYSGSKPWEPLGRDQERKIHADPAR